MPTPPASTSLNYKAALRQNIKGRAGKDKLPNSAYCTRSTTTKTTNKPNPTTRRGRHQQPMSTSKATNATTHNAQISKQQHVKPTSTISPTTNTTITGSQKPNKVLDIAKQDEGVIKDDAVIKAVDSVREDDNTNTTLTGSKKTDQISDKAKQSE